MKKKMGELFEKVKKSINEKPAMWIVMVALCLLGMAASCFIQNGETRKAVFYISAGLGVNIAFLGIGNYDD